MADKIPLDADWKKHIGENVDSSLDRISRFLDKRQTYAISVKPDELRTGRVWIISLHGRIYDLYVAYLCDATEIAATRLCRSISMMLQVFGYDIRSIADEEFVFLPEEMEQIKILETIKSYGDVQIEVRQSPTLKTYSFIAHRKEGEAPIVALGGMTAIAAAVLAKQFAILLAALGKDIIADDGTLLSKFGTIEICPAISVECPKIEGLQPWLLAANGFRLILPPVKMIERIDYNPFQTKTIDFSPAAKYLGWISEGRFVTHCCLVDKKIAVPSNRVAAMEVELYTASEAEKFIQNCIRSFIEKYGIFKVRVHVVKKTFLSSHKACLSLVIEDIPE